MKLFAVSFKGEVCKGKRNMENDAFSFKNNNCAFELNNNNSDHVCDEGVDAYCVSRAAAFSKLGNYAGAVQDCEQAIGIDPSYSKAYGRMGYEHSSL